MSPLVVLEKSKRPRVWCRECDTASAEARKQLEAGVVVIAESRAVEVGST
jgi:hypothetical protein